MLHHLILAILFFSLKITKLFVLLKVFAQLAGSCHQRDYLKNTQLFVLLSLYTIKWVLSLERLPEEYSTACSVKSLCIIINQLGLVARNNKQQLKMLYLLYNNLYQFLENLVFIILKTVYTLLTSSLVNDVILIYEDKHGYALKKLFNIMVIECINSILNYSVF